ncbi:unnamed protein product [Paramecium sonneborni]|uniref:MORN repeat protein n=1 Tax=Paramecium sonneborni TaxID=65129 RepID=A0A8S1R5N6_9CILI|nr:unnamed protein product [Paramecium sonneborni]
MGNSDSSVRGAKIKSEFEIRQDSYQDFLKKLYKKEVQSNNETDELKKKEQAEIENIIQKEKNYETDTIEESPIQYLVRVLSNREQINVAKDIIKEELEKYLEKNIESTVWSSFSYFQNCFADIFCCSCCLYCYKKCCQQCYQNYFKNCCRKYCFQFNCKQIEVSDFKTSSNKLDNNCRFYGKILFDDILFKSSILNTQDSLKLKEILKCPDLVYLLKYLLDWKQDKIINNILDDLKSENEDATTNQVKTYSKENSNLKQLILTADLATLQQISIYNNDWQFNKQQEDFEDLYNGFCYGKRCGYGIQITENSIYIGQFFNNKYHGYGKIQKGLLDDKILVQKEELFFADEKENDIFEFENHINSYQMPNKNSQQIIKYPRTGQQSIEEPPKEYLEYYVEKQYLYVGEHKNSIFNGWGIMKFCNGNQYKGQWEAGEMHGTGHFTWVNGEEYLGEYVKGKKHGFGKYKYDNKIYLGPFKDGLQHGKGLMKRGDSEYFETEWYEGKIQY